MKLPSHTDDFENWWASYWKRSSQPEVFDLALKEIAKAGYDAGESNGYNKGHDDGYDEGRDDGTK